MNNYTGISLKLLVSICLEFEIRNLPYYVILSTVEHP